LSGGSVNERVRNSKWRTGGRSALTVGLPVATAASTAIAALNSGSTRAYISLVAIAATFGTAYIGMQKDRKVQSSAVEAQAAIEEAVELAAKKKEAVADAVTKAGKPIVNQLCIIARAPSAEARRASVEVLVSRIVELAQSQCGRFSGVPCKTRSVLYRLDHTQTRLLRYRHEGRNDDAPRSEFDSAANAKQMAVVDLAKSERVLLVRDLDKERHLVDRTTNYKAFISIPVRAQGQSYGMLSVDSDQVASLGEIDLGYMILLAGSLAAGLAQLGDDPWSVLAQNSPQVPHQSGGPMATSPPPP
jgi:hypothetical protein